MKAPRLLAVATLSAAPFAIGDEVGAGDSLAQVRATLGTPRGQVRIEDRQLLYYERGEVELQADQVIRVALRTPAEQAERDAREDRLRAERAESRGRLVAQGEALRDRRLADEAFKSAPLAYQVTYWETLARAYPGVSVLEPLTIARMRLAEQQAGQVRRDEQAARIADLEARLAERDAGPTVYPLYTSSSYGYGFGHYRPYNPPNLFRSIRYDFNTSSAAPYETPHGSPYETPRGSPYETPGFAPYTTPAGAVVGFPGYNPASAREARGYRADYPRAHRGRRADRDRS